MTPHSLPASFTAQVNQALSSTWISWLRRALQAIESRRHLAEMDCRMLSDIGINRSEALKEAGRAPWDLTPQRR